MRDREDNLSKQEMVDSSCSSDIDRGAKLYGHDFDIVVRERDRLWTPGIVVLLLRIYCCISLLQGSPSRLGFSGPEKRHCGIAGTSLVSSSQVPACRHAMRRLHHRRAVEIHASTLHHCSLSHPSLTHNPLPKLTTIQPFLHTTDFSVYLRENHEVDHPAERLDSLSPSGWHLPRPARYPNIRQPLVVVQVTIKF